ncbi:hexokinase-domain-containing protein [Mrakia frigida]|uniref:hexokinase-domain-containing protein n=1 Tax=Mrakia frigida TaxID=29902 RepID=UPI003FCC0FA6
MAPTPLTTTTVDLSHLPEAVRAFNKDFHLEPARLSRILEAFQSEFMEGLQSFGKDVAMIPSYINGVPDGQEQGTFLALDLGGTNLRVCEVRLLGDHKFTIKQQKYKVSDEIKQGEASELFGYIADSIDAFLTELGTESEVGEELHLGFTFSFPVEQTALASGKILTWTKGFSAKNAIGHDVVVLLQDALDKRHIHVKCSALVNDTVGTMLSASYQAGPALIGAIFGTGTNGAYLEDLVNIKKLGADFIKEQAIKTGPKMIINTEWGALDNNRFVIPFTQFDGKLDRESINPHKQAFEKLVSGMYLGEIVRNILIHFIDQSILFKGYSTDALNSHYGLDTAVMSDIEAAADLPTSPSSNSAPSPSSLAIRRILVKELGVKSELINEEDVEIVKWAVIAVGTRAASMSACAIATVVDHTHSGEEQKESTEVIDVGIDGSMAELYPHFNERLRDSLVILLGEKLAKRVRISLAKDGSGVGGESRLLGFLSLSRTSPR